MLGYLIAAAGSGLFVGLGLSYAYHRAAFSNLHDARIYSVYKATKWRLEANSKSELIGSLQEKLFAIADATRNGKSGTARKVYKMTGRCHD